MKHFPRDCGKIELLSQVIIFNIVVVSGFESRGTDDSFIGPVNIGNPHEFSMLELANLIIDITGSKSKLVFMSLPKDDPTQRKPDITLAKEKLDGWEPTVPLKEGLVKTIEYFDDLLQMKKYKMQDLFDNELLKVRV